MSKKMLIDATHPEETRVVVVDGNKVEEFDFESVNKRQLAGNIYLAKVTRVEPSLQAAFVDYGGNRHGFLAFSEIHPDYYQIPVADREALLAEEKAHAKEQAEEDEQPRSRSRRRSRRRKSSAEKAGTDAVRTAEVTAEVTEEKPATDETAIPGMDVVDLEPAEEAVEPIIGFSPDDTAPDTDGNTAEATAEAAPADTDEPTEATDVEAPQDEAPETAEKAAPAPEQDIAQDTADDEDAGDEADGEEDEDDTPPSPAEVDPNIEAVADDDDHEDIRPRRKPRPRRYKIQEVIKVRQILLVQVVKEERGNKGAALTTYLSLAGRYCVLMPNTARGGGISRKITNAADRKRLKQIAAEIDIPEGAGLIIRTAGAKRTKAEIKRDYEFLLRQWEQVRDLTLKSIAPAPIYEEGSLIKRSIRDLYDRDIEEILIEGEQGYRVAKDYMKMLMPSHAKNVKQYTDPMPLFARYQVESYLSGMFNPVVQLKSGGYIVIGVTEALVAIDVNSGRSTKEGSIEDTALKTNLEAAEEVARQLRLRDLAGLIVIDFIDMEDRRNNAAVEKRIKEKLKSDRARIQVGRISGFGLMEMSRQRLRPGMIEATTAPCPHCHGTGLTRSDDNLALSILRELEEEGVRQRTREILVTAPVGIANFILNQKRDHVAAIEKRYGMVVRVEASPLLISPDYTIERFKTTTRQVPAPSVEVVSMESAMIDAPEVEEAAPAAPAEPAAAEASEDGAPRKKRRRRRRRGGRGRNGDNGQAQSGADETARDEDENTAAEAAAPSSDEGDSTQTPEQTPAAASTDEATPDQAEEKPASKPRKRTTRRAAAKAEKADADQADQQQPTEQADTPAEATTDSGEEKETKPKPRKRRSRKKAPEVTEEQPATSEPTESAAAAAPEAPVTEPLPAEETASEPATAPEEAAPQAEEAAPAASDDTAAAKPVEPAPEPEPATEQPAAAEAAPDAATEADEPEKKPRRRGWWSRVK
ncbi:MAG: Rne/Rng family ribonuclease [Paracoccaceae bacterium]|nr:Rne/Rng family ribonuclease [Paracoccaceae bacterium]